MFQQLLYTQWRSARLGLIPMVGAAFGLPLLAVQDLGHGLEVSGMPTASIQAEVLFAAWSVWLPFFPSLALLVGGILALNAWNWDHNGNHIYALSLPVPRWRYVLLKMAAGVVLLLLPVLALGAGSFLGAGTLDLASNLHAYPLHFTARFLWACLIIYGLLFAFAAGTVRTTLIVLSVFLAFFLAASPKLDWSLAQWLMQSATEWPGPFEVYFGNWNLIDV